MRLALRLGAWVYVGVMLVGVLGTVYVASTTTYGVRINGCYHYDAMLVGPACMGFFGAPVIEALLLAPFYLLYLPIITWLPFVYLGVSYHKQRRRKSGAPNEALERSRGAAG